VPYRLGQPEKKSKRYAVRAGVGETGGSGVVESIHTLFGEHIKLKTCGQRPHIVEVFGAVVVEGSVIGPFHE
jgi:hypothetical protein